MKRKYRAAFILPANTNKELGDDGWEFESLERLSNKIMESLVEVLSLKFLESYLGIAVYTNTNVKMSIERDDQNLIEHISFQIYDSAMEGFKKKVKACPWYEQIDCFVPSETNYMATHSSG
ncbi:hypothetical protein GCM10007978_49800 [Shewanella hanedai]|uniref:Uncharacterized protein n=1 Tax=Shewanella hanedai TaxID=25 RepID=A0A553JCL0_SHEHA|nr:hypothetical protein [Shewanella hanedai]TRY10192.1 hypothetical protein FN961_25465 [Shewanella hanedai]GGJ06222.1 hypothetical protein GCM10007978_49800 [Shewanella hanedai]